MDIRVSKVEQRVTLLRKKHRRRLTGMLVSMCFMLASSLVKVSSTMIGEKQVYVLNFYGTTMLFKDAGGYVLVGVVFSC